MYTYCKNLKTIENPRECKNYELRLPLQWRPKYMGKNEPPLHVYDLSSFILESFEATAFVVLQKM